MKRLLPVWLVFVLAMPLAFAWIEPDIRDGSEVATLARMFLSGALAGLIAVALLYAQFRNWRRGSERLESFLAALPAAEASIPQVEQPELSKLVRAMGAMAQRVRQVMDRASVELSRRETILACMAEGVLAVDKDLKVIFCNTAFAQAFGARMTTVEGRTLYEVVREPMLRDILERVVKTGTSETDRFQLPSAAGRWFEARALPVNEQRERGAVIVLHDVTDLERQEQVRKDFVADVSHELRTPLAAIRGYAETLLDGALEDAENNRKFVEVIQAHAIRLNNIASDLLVISELDSNTAPVNATDRIAVLDVIESAIHTVENAAAAKQVRILMHECEPCWVTGYRFRLEQVMVNLLDNAVKFNRADGEVVVECHPLPEGRVRVSVADTGIGIPHEDIKRIFERFYRVDKARSRPAGGTGLGLPIVKEVVERMGGTVAVDSVLGRGSKFTILLQSADAPAAVAR